jgi:hypothetical protein
MKAIELKEELSKFLREKGTESFTKLVSDSIDEAGPHDYQSIAVTRINFAAKFAALSSLNLTER